MLPGAVSATLPQDVYARLLVREGGNVDNPADPGGRTSRGVIQHTYDDWRRARGLSTRDVFEMTDAECHAIYEGGYWKGGAATPAAQLAWVISEIHFDATVQHGGVLASEWLRLSGGDPTDYLARRAAFMAAWCANPAHPERAQFAAGFRERVAGLAALIPAGAPGPGAPAANGSTSSGAGNLALVLGLTLLSIVGLVAALTHRQGKT